MPGRRILFDVMGSPLRVASAAAILALLLPLHLLSVLPAFHRHSDELGRWFHQAFGTHVETASDASVASPDDCPACAASRLQAVAPMAVAVAAPCLGGPGPDRAALAALPSRSVLASKGRAPPSVA